MCACVPRLSVCSAAALQWQRGVGSCRQIVLNAIMDESIMCPEGLKDSAVCGLDARHVIPELSVFISVDF